MARTDKYDHNLSEGLPIINDMSAKMTSVVNDLCGCFLNQRLEELCGQLTVWSMIYVVDDLTCVVNDLTCVVDNLICMVDNLTSVVDDLCGQ